MVGWLRLFEMVLFCSDITISNDIKQYQTAPNTCEQRSDYFYFPTYLLKEKTQCNQLRCKANQVSAI